MYGNLKYEQQRQVGNFGEREPPSLLSWRAQDQNINNAVAHTNRPRSPRHQDFGSRFDDGVPNAPTLRPAHSGGNLSGRGEPESLLSWRAKGQGQVEDISNRFVDSLPTASSRLPSNPGMNLGEREPQSLLSWRAEGQGINNGVPPRSRPCSPPLHKGGNLADREAPSLLSWGARGVNDGGALMDRPRSPVPREDFRSRFDDGPMDVSSRLPAKHVENLGEREAPSLLSWRANGSGIINGGDPIDRSRSPIPREGCGNVPDRERPSLLSWQTEGRGINNNRVPSMDRSRSPVREGGNVGEQEPKSLLSWPATGRSRDIDFVAAPTTDRCRSPPLREGGNLGEREPPSLLSWRAKGQDAGRRFDDSKPIEPNRISRNTDLDGRYEDTSVAALHQHATNQDERHGDFKDQDRHSLTSSQLPRDLDNRCPSERSLRMPSEDMNKSLLPDPYSRIPPAGGRPSDPLPLMSLTGTNDICPSGPPSQIPPARERHKGEDDLSRLSWRSSQLQPGADNTRPSEHPSRIPPSTGTNNTQRSSGPGPTPLFPPGGNIQQSEPPSRIPPAGERNKDGDDLSRLSWRSTQLHPGSDNTRLSELPSRIPPTGANNTRPSGPGPTPLFPPGSDVQQSEPPSRIPPAGERYKDDDLSMLSWRSSQPGANNTRLSEPTSRIPPTDTNNTRHFGPGPGPGPIPLFPPGSENQQSEPPSRIPPAGERYKANDDLSRLSWRSSQLQPGTSNTRLSGPGPTPLFPQGSDVQQSEPPSRIPPAAMNDTRVTGPKPLFPTRGTNDESLLGAPPTQTAYADERRKDNNKVARLSWRSNERPPGPNNARPSEPLSLMPPPGINSTRPSGPTPLFPSRGDQLKNTNEPSSLNWRTIQAAVGNIGHSEDLSSSPRKGPNNNVSADARRVLPEERYEDTNAAGLVRQSRFPGTNMNLSNEGNRTTPGSNFDDMKGLSWRDRTPGGEVLGKRRHADMSFDDRLPVRDTYDDRPRSYPSKAYY